MPNIYFVGLFAVLIVSGLAGSYLKGRSDGSAIVTATYAQRDVKAAADYQAKETALQNEYRKQEQNWQEKFVSQARSYEGKVKENAKALDIALTSGRLYDRFAAHRPASRDCSAPISSDTVAASQAGTELSEQLTQYLKREASRADKVVLDLNLCIGVLEAERN